MALTAEPASHYCTLISTLNIVLLWTEGCMVQQPSLRDGAGAWPRIRCSDATASPISSSNLSMVQYTCGTGRQGVLLVGDQNVL